MSAHPASHRRGLVAALVAQAAGYLLDPIEQIVESEPVELVPHPVVAVVSAAPRSGASSVARMLAAELAARADGAAVVVGAAPAGWLSGPPLRAASRLATALGGAARAAQPVGRLCVLTADDLARVAGAARYLAPVVVEVAPDGTASASAGVADGTIVVAGAAHEPALARAIARVLGGGPIVVANRVADCEAWTGRADFLLPEARLAARAAAVGTRAPGPLGAAIADLAETVKEAS